MEPRQLRDKSSFKLVKLFRRQFLGNVMMIYLSLIAILILCGVQGVQSMKNGLRAGDTEFPFVVSIQYQLFHLGSGTIIDNYHILTVGHVVVSHSPSDLLVASGMSMVKWPYSRTSAVKNIYLHPHYQAFATNSVNQSDLYWENDIAILQLTEPLPLSSFVGIVSLSITNLESYRCFECTMISWNYVNERDMDMVVRMWDVVHMVENNRCEQWGIHVLRNQQCFIDIFDSAFISTEDLGSPIICGDSMVGLIVREARQGYATSPATFISTFNYAEFISEIIKRGEISVQPGEFPYMVSIWRNNKHACGGVIVNTNQVITAGHCLWKDRRMSPKRIFKIAAGSNVLSVFDRTVQWYTVMNMALHPEYRRSYSVNKSNDWIEHDIGLITVSGLFSLSPTIQTFRLADTDDFSTKQLCQILHWTRKYTEDERQYRILTKSSAVLLDQEQLLVQLRTLEIAAKELYSTNQLELTDIGNPIICEGHLLGIMVRIYSMNMESQTPQIVFLRIRQYFLQRFLISN